jgi:hypothetical protein
VNVTKISAAARLLAVATTVFAGLFFTAGPAAAADDSWWIESLADAPCSIGGRALFVDNGEGAPGGGNNDDYIVLEDWCRNSQGVKAYAWLDGKYLGSKYWGGGWGTGTTWDPFGNVTGGQSVGMKICNTNGPSGSPWGCVSGTRKSIDG